MASLLPLYRRTRGNPGPATQFPRDFIHEADALVDDRLLPALQAVPPRCWGLMVQGHTSYGQFTTRVGGKAVNQRLHRSAWELAFGPVPNGMTIDHRNRDGLDCRLVNLRLATHSQQIQNQRKFRRPGRLACSSYKGVRKQNARKSCTRWTARISISGGGRVSLGHFPTEVEAAFAWNVAAGILHGQFAVLNIIPPGSLSPLQEAVIEALVRSRLGLPVSP